MTAEKIFLTKTPALPAKCAVCYSDVKEDQEFLDFGVSLDYFGAILICPFCMVNAAKLVGFAPVAEVKDELNPLLAELAFTKQKVSALELLVASYVSGSPFNIDSLLNNFSDVQIPFEFSSDHEDDVNSESSDESESSEQITV